MPISRQIADSRTNGNCSPAFSFGGEAFLGPKEPGIQITFFVLIMVLLYTISMASYCVARQPILAVVGTIATLWGGAYVLGSLVPNGVHWAVPLVVLVVCQLAAFAFAWLALSKNWGW